MELDWKMTEQSISASTANNMTKSSQSERNHLYVCDLLEPNTAIFDEEEDYLKQIASQSLECPCDLYNELLISHDFCENLFHLALYQQILYNEKRVRLKPGNDIYSNKAKIERIHLSMGMKTFLFKVSELAYKLLKKENLLGDFIELDSENDGIVMFKEKQRTLNFHSDVLSLINKSDKSNKEATSHKTKNEAKMSMRTKKYRFPRRGEKANINTRTFGVTKLETEYDITESEDSDQSEDDENVSVTLTFVLTVRNSLPAVKVLEQCLSNIAYPKSKKFMLACHIGPMVEEQHIALYKHRCSRQYRGVFEIRDIDKIMQIWDKTKGKTTFIMTDPKESLKYSIYNNSPSTSEDDDDDYDYCDIDDVNDEDNEECDRKSNDSQNPDEINTINTKSVCFSFKEVNDQE